MQAQATDPEIPACRAAQNPDDRGERIDEGRGCCGAEVDCMQLRKAEEELAYDGFIDIFVQVLLDKNFPQIRCKLQTLEQGARCHILDFGVHLSGSTETNRGEV